MGMGKGGFGGPLGFGNVPLVTPAALYYLRSYAVLFVVGIVGATPVVKQIGSWIAARKAGAVLEAVFLAAMLLVCTAYLVDGSFSPFLYFRF
jgi:alginate O-acetyltransferase complex protein AlgI